MTRRLCLRTLVASTLAVAFPAQAQRASPPTIGFLSGTSAARWRPYLLAFKEGLRETGYVEGENVAIEYRWAEQRTESLPALAAELVRRQVSVIVATAGGQTAVAARNATSTIPIVFTTGADPVRLGLVQTLGRPGGNVTGVAILALLPMAKRLELMHELLPGDHAVAFLINPDAAAAPNYAKDAVAAGPAFGRRVKVFHARDPGQMDEAVREVVRQQFRGLVVVPDPLFDGELARVVRLTEQLAVPTLFGYREYVAAGGLISYGPSLSEAYRQVGVYAGRILDGAKPADLPVVQPTRFELVVNLKTAEALRLTIPRALVARADELLQ